LAEIINPVLLYVGVALGALGVLLALPRRGVSPQPIGGLFAGIAGGLVLLGLGIRAEGAAQLPSVYFYIFALIALGGSLRVISHPRPVYAALYFILTILSSAGLYILLSAEFMAFALVIIYAGAILITYLFVLMMATQAPSEEEVDQLAEYDTTSREPAVAVLAGFLLLATLTTMLFSGSGRLAMPGEGALAARPGAVLEKLPVRVERVLRDAELISEQERVVRLDAGRMAIDVEAREARVGVPMEDEPRGEEAYAGVRAVALPETLRGRNVESLAFDFLNRHPGAIEIAGVILLMAMLGAVVLSRRQIDIEEEAKRAQARRLAAGESRP